MERTRSWRANTSTLTHTHRLSQCGENDGGGGGMKEFAGTMRHRESAGETVSLAQLGRTRAPLYSASLPLRGPTKAFLVFDTTTLVALCVFSSLPPILLSIASSLSPFFSVSLGAKRTERLSLRGFEGEGKTTGLLRAQRDYCGSLVATFAGSMTRTSATHATLLKEERESPEARIIALLASSESKRKGQRD